MSMRINSAMPIDAKLVTLLSTALVARGVICAVKKRLSVCAQSSHSIQRCR